MSDGSYRQQWHRIVEESTYTARQVNIAGITSRLLERGEGPTLLVLHGSDPGVPFLMPLLERLDGMRVIAAERPGLGLSDAFTSSAPIRELAVAWIEGLLDELSLDEVMIAGHSMGGLWAIWFALAHPERVSKLVVMAAPALPGTRPPLPFRVLASRGLGHLIARFGPASRKAVLQFAHAVGEGETLPAYDDMIDLAVAATADRAVALAQRADVRRVVSSWALRSSGGFRRDARLGPEELRRLAAPTLILWGDRDPVGSVDVARAIAEMIPEGRLHILPTGHAPWLGEPDRTAQAIVDFIAAGPPSAD